MDTLNVDSITSGCKKHSRTADIHIGYGTAGFRRNADDLDHVLYRVGLLTVLRSKVKDGATIGAMITASHNPEEDNGVKVVDAMGEMLEERWEQYAVRLANVSDKDVTSCLESIIATEEIDLKKAASVVYARDTRPSSVSLASALEDGINALQGNYQNYGLLTTPQLHYMVRCINSKEAYGKPTETAYFEKLSKAFRKLIHQPPSDGNYKPSLLVDAANGVGAKKLEILQTYLEDVLSVNVINDGKTGKLNHKCGADYVKMQQTAPEGVDMHAEVKYASFDGDADRIVFYYAEDVSRNTKKKFHLLDGDKIATLIAGYLKELLHVCDLDLDLGIVQTVYANGSSAKYITEQLGVPVACVPTGVKHLHHRALQMDIGVYFEANGHGTILFSENATQKIMDGAGYESLPKEQKKAFDSLVAVIDVTNQTVGDAISDMLLVEIVLHHRGWNFRDWNSTYTDLPNKQMKVQVEDRTVINTTDAERKTTTPPGLQSEIDAIVAKYPSGRSFVRPSGTEDVVRVYAECSSEYKPEDLAREVAVKVYEMCRGVGARP